MNLNHINLPVKDVLLASTFFETHFNFKPEGKVNDTIAILRGNNSFVLVLMSESLNQNGNNIYPDAFHIGFFQETENQVTAIYKSLMDAKVDLADEPKRIRKTFGFYFKHQNILIEISTDVKAEI